MSVDDWKKLVDAAGLILLGITFLLGIASWKIGNVINARDDTAKKQLEGSVLEAKSGLAKQEERAALAERATEEIKRENISRDERLATAQKDAADSRAAQQRVEIQLGEQQERAAIAERELLKAQKELEAESDEMQRIMRPRSLPLQLSVGDPARDAEIAAKYAALKEFPEMPVIIFVGPDTEARTFASDLRFVLTKANWVAEIRDAQRRKPGIAVYSGHFPEGGPEPDTREWRAGVIVADLISVAFDAMEIGLSWPRQAEHYHEDLLPFSGDFARAKSIVAVVVGAREIDEQLEWLKMRRWMKEQAKKTKDNRQP